MAFFRNDTVNWLNLHYAVHALALSGSEAFLASFLLSVGGLALGRWIDRGHGARAVWLGVGGIAAGIAFRALGAGHPVLAVVANAAGAVGVALYVPTVMTAVYNQAKAAPCVLRFHLAAAHTSSTKAIGVKPSGFMVGSTMGSDTAAKAMKAAIGKARCFSTTIRSTTSATLISATFSAGRPMGVVRKA